MGKHLSPQYGHVILVWQLSTEHSMDLQYKDTGSHTS